MDGGLDDAGQLPQFARGGLQHSVEVERAAEASRHLTEHTLTSGPTLTLLQQARVLQRQGNLGAHLLHQRNLLR